MEIATQSAQALGDLAHLFYSGFIFSLFSIGVIIGIWSFHG